MSDCNATLATAKLERAPDGFVRLLGEALLIDGKWFTITIYSLPCLGDTNGPHVRHIYIENGLGAHVFWEDETPGATAHVEPDDGVTPAMVYAALESLGGWVDALTYDQTKVALAVALAAQKDTP
jgi:hypothetical protein